MFFGQHVHAVYTVLSPLLSSCLPPFPLSLSLTTQSPCLSLSLSVSWTSCSVALKYGTLCRSADHRSALHPDSECNVNDMMIPSKATLTLLSLSFFKCKGWLHDTMKQTARFTLSAVVVLAEDHSITKAVPEQSWLKRGNSTHEINNYYMIL